MLARVFLLCIPLFSATDRYRQLKVKVKTPLILFFLTLVRYQIFYITLHF